MLQWTGERFLPGVEGDIVVEHLHRYHAVAELVDGLQVLDVACGEGYGSTILARRAARVIGVDISVEAVAHASAQYPRDNLRFVAGSCAQIPLPDASVDAIVSFETIEHIAEQEQTLREFARVLRPGGWACISSPDKLEYSDLPGFKNEYHVRELYADEFRDLLQRSFASVVMYGQRVQHGSMLGPVGRTASRFFSYRSEGDGAVRGLGVLRPLYLVAMASNAACPELPSGSFETAEPAFLAQVRELEQQLAEARLARAGPPGAPVDVGRLTSLETTTASLYMRRAGEESLSEERAKHAPFALNDTEVEISFELPASADAPLAQLRLDLAQRICLIDVFELALVADGARLWSWVPGEDHPLPWREPSGMVAPAEAGADVLRVLCTNADPHCTLDIPADALGKAWGEGRLVVRLKGALVADTAVSGLAPLGAALETSIAHAGQQVERLAAELERVRGEATRLAGELAVAQAHRQEAVGDRDRVHAELKRAQAENLEVLRLLADATRERDNAAARGAQLSDQLSALTARCLAGEEALQRIVDSRTWGAPAWLRRIRVNAIAVAGRLRAGLARAARRAWQMLPADLAWKRALKDWIFSSAGPLLGSTAAYQRWIEHRRSMLRIDQQIAEANGALVVPDDTPTVGERSSAPLKPLRLPALPEPKAIPLTSAPPLHSTPVRLIAFYLPQFHPIVENDAWWGRGFTEWTNVTRAVPQFVGHYQPHLPGELGFYDLRLPEVQRRQVELARLYGIGAFCFYLYWFAGKKLLERPLLQYLADPTLDLPFCVCWANENWTRRWDGMDAEVLMAQRHSREDDLAFIEYVAQFLRDGRYVRIDGKPLLLVYRPSLLPSALETAQLWRAWCREHGVGEIYLAYTQSFEAFDPAEYGFDAAIEFPPNLYAPPVITDRIERLNPEFSGAVLDWTAFVERSHNYAARTPPYKLFRAVMPSWDNEARRPGRGAVFWGSNPDRYRTWLQNAIVDTVSRFGNRDERLVFVNAWNEWAEGAHLEPDRRYGYAWLQATRDALVTTNAGERPRVLIVSHDAHPHGAQFLALHLAQGFAEDLRCYVDIVLLGEGELAAEFAQHGVVHSLAGEDPEGARAVALANRLRAAGTRAAICNTTVSGRFMATLKRAGIRCVTLVHEMPGIVASQRLEHEARCIADQSDVVVFPAKIVADGFRRFGALADLRTRLRPQGLYKRNRYASASGRDEARAALRMRLGLPAETRVVLAVGYADHRKGIDLFVEVGTALMRSDARVVFVWLGHHDLQLWPSVRASVEASGFADRFLFPGRVADTDVFYAGADVLALPSREDPFPSVVLEALQVGVPVVAFEGSSGCCELIAQGCGLLAPALDVGAFADALRRLLDNPTLATELGGEGANRVARDFSFRRYLFDLAQWLELPLKRVSVVVPNYNYGAMIAQRLASIEQQTYPVYELIVLDDASTDGSVEAIRQQLATLAIDTRLVVNERNSGSVFRQWRHGAELASGDIVWIAEADDLADPEFLEATVAAFVDSEVVVSYCQSRQMGPDGAILCEHYRDYTADVSTDKWLEPYVADGTEEIRTALAIKNTIPNVSAVLFRRDALLSALDLCGARLAELRVAGDWLVYVTMLATGRIAFTPRALNSHRRHPGSVTVSNFNLLQLREIVTMQQSIRRRFALDDAVRRVATAYAQRLFEQFGLQRDRQSRVEEHPLLAPALGE